MPMSEGGASWPPGPWTGYLRPDGRKGVRNLVLVLYTVECAQHVAGDR